MRGRSTGSIPELDHMATQRLAGFIAERCKAMIEIQHIFMDCGDKTTIRVPVPTVETGRIVKIKCVKKPP